MASFKYHVNTAFALSVVSSAFIIHHGVATPEQSAILVICGTLGGILPDIDSDSGIPLRVVFLGLSLASVHIAELFEIWRYAVAYLPQNLIFLSTLIHILISFVAALSVYGLLPAFKRWTKHRGVFHSILAAVVFWLACNPWLGSVAATFVAWGFVWHLVLDEIYSVLYSPKTQWTALKFVGPRWQNNLVFLTFGIALLFVNWPDMFMYIWYNFSQV